MTQGRSWPGVAGSDTRSPGKVLVAKLGLDGHDVGAKVVARLLRDAGFEVVYLGIRQTAEAVTRAAVDEDVDVIGLSMLSGSHVALVTRVFQTLREAGESALPVVLGGVIPPEDHEEITALGVREIFDAGDPPEQMVERIRTLAAERRAATGKDA